MRKKKSHSSKIHPGLDRKPGGPDNWVEKTGGLPSYIKRIAKHIHYDSGLSISHSIAAAVERCKVLAAKGNAQAIAAIAQWNANRARSKGKSKKFASTVQSGQLIDLSVAKSSKVTKIRSAKATSGTVSGRSTGAFDERKHVRSPMSGQFSEKFTSSQLLAARRVVEGAITNLGVGQSVNLPNDLGFVKRTEAGYVVQGPAGFYVSTNNMTEAIAAAASIIAGKMQVSRA